MGSTATGVFESIDGSAIRFDSNTGVYTDRTGIRNTPFVMKEDPNGNKITSLDTLGRQSSSAALSVSSCPTGQRAVTSATVGSIPGPSGTTTQVAACYVTVPLQTSFQTDGTQGNTHATMLQSIMLYNGVSWATSQTWKFEYDDRDQGDAPSVNYGSLTKITFPSGGTLAYKWTTAYGATQFHRSVSSRTVDAADGSGPHTWTYSWLTNTTVVTDPLGNDTVHTLGPVIGYIRQVQYYQGSSTSGTLLKTESTDYTWTTIPNLTCNGAVFNVLPIRVTTTWPGGKVKKVEKDYDSAFTFQNPNSLAGGSFAASYGQVTAVREYDYGSGSAGPLLRQTLNAYMVPANPTYQTYNLLDLPSSVTVKDGSGLQKAYTSYIYDGSVPDASGVTTQHDAAPPNGAYRGNLTSVGRWVNSPPATLTSTATFYDTGEVHLAKDPLLNQTTYGYSPTFVGAYPTTITNALSQVTTLNYDFNTGLKTSVTDPNLQTTTYAYDALQRLTQVSYPDNGQTNYIYYDSAAPFSVAINKKINSGLNLSATAIVDGVGRTTQTQLNSDPACISPNVHHAIITYNARGRKSTVENPNCSSGDATYGITTNNYDALGRVTKIIPPDGTSSANNVTSAYSDNCVTVTDEQSKGRKSCTDGLGRVTQVNEDPNGLNYPTTYQYDTLDNLTNVNQSGQTRTFVYDSLSRLTSASNPESGTVSYGYDSNSNLATRLDARGVTTNYGYDALNRISSKNYVGMTVKAANYYYDESTTPFSGSTTLINTKGRLSHSTTTDAGNGTATVTVHTYDPMGRTNGFWQCWSGTCAPEMTYTYDLAGDVTQRNEIWGITNYAFNGAQQVTTVTTPTVLPNLPATLATLIYRPFGAIENMYDGCTPTPCTGSIETYNYNNRLQPVMIRLGNSTNLTANSCTVYNYYADVSSPYGTPPCGLPTPGAKNNGNVAGYFYQDTSYSNLGHTMTYGYDNLNRLSSAVATGSATMNLTYQYPDPFGNVQCVQNSQTNGQCPQMSYNTKNQLTSIGSTTLGYDAAGQMTWDGTNTHAYDGEGRLLWVYLGTDPNYYTEAEEWYNAEGQRVERYNANVGWETIYNDPWGNESEVLHNGTVEEIYLPPVAGRHYAMYMSGNTYFTHANALGSTGMVTDQTGGPRQEVLYTPWGYPWTYAGSNPNGYYIDMRYAGMKPWDPQVAPEVGLSFTPNRAYYGISGRWTTPDPAGTKAVTLNDPQTWNMYAYVRNNPTTLTDPSGLWCIRGIGTTCSTPPPPSAPSRAAHRGEPTSTHRLDGADPTQREKGNRVQDRRNRKP